MNYINSVAMRYLDDRFNKKRQKKWMGEVVLQNSKPSGILNN